MQHNAPDPPSGALCISAVTVLLMQGAPLPWR